jgi:hypothetical protein
VAEHGRHDLRLLCRAGACCNLRPDPQRYEGAPSPGTLEPDMIHLVKLCVGCDSIEDLAQWQAERLARQRAVGKKAPELFHTTFQTPKRREDLIGGGSLYWIIKGLIQVRQRVLDLKPGKKEDGSPCCLVILDPAHVAVRPTPRRAFQGWRYLDAADAPPDLAGGAAGAVAGLPPAMRRELAELGLI